MKICFICNEYPPSIHGGIGATVRILATELVKRGHQVRIAGLYRNDDVNPNFQEDDGVQIWRLKYPQSKFRWIVARVYLFRFVYEWIKRGDVDLVEVPDYEGYIAGWPPLSVPLITRMHGSGSYNLHEQRLPITKKYFWLEKASIKRSDFYCAVSNYAAQVTKSLFGLKKKSSIISIHNPIKQPVLSKGVFRSKNKVVFTGTLVPRKGIIKLIEAWPQIYNQCSNAELHVYGRDGRTQNGTSMQAFLMSEIKENKVQGVFFHGHVPREQLLAVLQTARVGVFPSYAETFGNAPVEAMATGCPTIYSKRSCGPEIITDHKSGILVDPENISEIVESVVSILKDDSLAAQLGYVGKLEAYERFSTNVIIPQNEVFYADCTERFHA